MKPIHFDEVKSRISNDLSFFEEYPLYHFYIIRDVFGRISVYIAGEGGQKDDSLLTSLRRFLIKQLDNNLIHTHEFVKRDSILFKQLQVSTTSLNETPNVFFGERHITRLNWFRTKEKSDDSQVLEGHKTKTVAFYSFKGGVGRTTSLVLTALHLVQMGKKVVVVDFDLEAPSLSSLLVSESMSTYGVVDYLLESQIYGTALAIDDYVYAFRDEKLVGSEAGELYVMPASNPTTADAGVYLEKMGRIDFSTPAYMEDDNPLRRLLEQVSERYQPDFIFLDARTGIHDVGGLMLTQYADLAVLLFNGSKQNLAGMQLVLPEVVKAGIDFLLMNSPTPISPEEQQVTRESYIETAYSILAETGYYDEGNMPHMLEQNADHTPTDVKFNPAAMFINSREKIADLLEDGSAYFQLAQHISRHSVGNKERLATVTPTQESGKTKSMLEAFAAMTSGTTAASEDEMKTADDLTKKFYPLREHKFIFERDKFLILGSKGSGKTALFSVLEHQEYATDLANFVGVSPDSIKGIRWVQGLKMGGDDVPDTDNFYSIGEEDNLPLFRRYWRLLALRSIYKQVDPPMLLELPEDFRDVPVMAFDELGELAKDARLGEKLGNFLRQLDEHIKQQEQTIVIVYDALDWYLDKSFRGKMISALISMWYEYLFVFKHIRAKIFLRKDIFRSEVQDMTDKVKIGNYSVELTWTMDHLLAMVWKRAIEQSDELLQSFQDILEPLGMRIAKSDGTLLGYVPKADAEANKAILNAIVGERMGKGKAAFSYNWIKNHLADTNDEIFPRSMLKLFAEAAHREEEKSDRTDHSTLMSPKSFQEVMGSVSSDRVTDLLEEYKEYEGVFKNVKHNQSYFPADQEALEDALRKCGVEAGKEQQTIHELVKIGVMKPYQSRKGDPVRYHIPDIFLSGLGLTRKGPGAAGTQR